ncbi:MAG: phosphopantetheine-binding protein [Deltaproteobacteria bacterium]|jgi:acyl carrier protein|nr:phosphopantetheine-binding protein [Deltaproteobacteria bacterium]
MTKTDIENTLRASIVKELRLEGVKPEDIDAAAPLFGDEGLQLDSLDAVELVMIVEKEFGLVIKDAEEAKEAFTSLGELAQFILARRQAS